MKTESKFYLYAYLGFTVAFFTTGLFSVVAWFACYKFADKSLKSVKYTESEKSEKRMLFILYFPKPFVIVYDFLAGKGGRFIWGACCFSFSLWFVLDVVSKIKY